MTKKSALETLSYSGFDLAIGPDKTATLIYDTHLWYLQANLAIKNRKALQLRLILE